MEVSGDRYYPTFPFRLSDELAGVRSGEVFDFALSAIAERTDLFGAGRLFSVVGLLADKLSRDQALEALKFGLELFESSLENSDADGPWSEDLTPPTDTEGALAGYVWAGLGAPKASLRWEAAHTLRGLCALRCEDVLARLLRLAENVGGGPFVDARLRFYDLHARQWLLIALARAAQDDPEMLVPFTRFLISTAVGESHVLIRGLAAKTALTLFNKELLMLEPEVRELLAKRNTSRFPAIISSHYERYRYQHSGEDEAASEHSGFQLKGWITEPYSVSGIDDKDPWAGDICYPASAPAQFVTDLMDMHPDSEGRTWKTCGLHDQVAVWSATWGTYRERDDNDTAAEKGTRLQASIPFLFEFLGKINKDLIISVQMERRISRSRYSSNTNDDFGYTRPSARLFLAKN